MINEKYIVFFEVKGLKESIYGKIFPELEKNMQQELFRVYNMYADKVNSGITDTLNEEFEHLYPNYFKDNKDKKSYELVEYNKFMADGYQRLIVDKLNETNISPILNFYVDPEEVQFKGYLKQDQNITIEFYIIPVY